MAKILIIDDSPFTQHMLGMIVKMGGHQVIGTADDGKEGLQLFKKLQPDLVTLDWLMPVKSGEAVLRKIIDFDPEAKVVMITGWANKSIEDRVLEAGASAFLEKSNVQKDLLTVIDQILEN